MPAPSASTPLSPSAARRHGGVLGWMLDGMDAMLYAFALPRIAAEFRLGGVAAGSLAAMTLLSAALGGVLFGWLADRIGRARALLFSVLLYALCTAGSATAASLPAFLAWRLFFGPGPGGEWAAGAILVAESVPSERRARALGWVQSGWAVGYALAALLSTVVLSRWGWRTLFLFGASPALLALWIRLRVPEPAAWQALRPTDTARSSGAAAARGFWRCCATATPTGAVGDAAVVGADVRLLGPVHLDSQLSFDAADRRRTRAVVGARAVASCCRCRPERSWATSPLAGLRISTDGVRSSQGYVLAAALAVPLFVGGRARQRRCGSWHRSWALLAMATSASLACSSLSCSRWAIRGSAGGFCYNAGKALSAVSPPLVGFWPSAWAWGGPSRCSRRCTSWGAAHLGPARDARRGAVMTARFCPPQPVADHALRLVLASTDGPQVLTRQRPRRCGLRSALSAEPLDGVRELVPGYASILICCEPLRVDPEALSQAIVERLSQAARRRPRRRG